MTSLLMIVFVAFAVSMLATPVVRSVVLRAGVIDVPSDRSSHVTPTPRGGGIAILLGSIVAAAPFAAEFDRSIGLIFVAAAIIAVTGFADDVRGLHGAIKLSIQVIASSILIFGARLMATPIDLPGPARLSLPAAAAGILSLIWLVAVCNAYNFMDGINGIASFQTIVCGMAQGILAVQQRDYAAATVAVAIATATLGFLPWNYPTASIFMGDVGSTTIGCFFAALSLRHAQRGGSLIAAALPLAPFLFDTGITLLRRAWRREPIFTAHRNHYYQRLTALGWGHEGVALLWFCLAIVSGIGALLYESGSDIIRVLVLIVVFGVNVSVVGGVTYVEQQRT